MRLPESSLGNCDFCRIVADLEPARVVYEDDDTIAFFPLSPATKGHTLVVPKRHYADFLEAGEDQFSAIAAVAVKVGRAIRTALCPQGVNAITSAGEAASQSVFHLHLHVVPRWFGDPMGEIWPPKRTVSGTVQDELAARIRAACR